jgi:Uma2 family endonuclease
MIARPSPPMLSVEEFLELEQNSTVKHEYLDGHVYAMAGGTINHGVIAVNVVAALRPQLRGGPCGIYNSDVKVRLGPNRFVYPDVSVSCDPRDRADGSAQFVSHPCLVVEVLSRSTAEYDQGDKFEMYRDLTSLEEYLLIATERAAVELRSRQADGSWHTATYGLADTVALPSIGCQCPVAAFYDDIAL